MKVSCLKVPSKEAERIRRSLLSQDHIDHTYVIRSDGDHVLIPLKDTASFRSSSLYKDGMTILSSDLRERDHRPSSYKELLDLPADIISSLPGSYDMIGDVAIIKIEVALKEFSRSIGEALLNFNRRVRSVAIDNGVKGDLRVRDLNVIAGDPDLETVHLENNLRFKLDPSKVYFSPRLATERMRIASMVEKEKVLDMFAGVGPFSLTIARYSNAKKVIGIDLNPDCIHYFNQNISLNSLSETVEAYLGDAAEISSSFAPFDRVIMNLPHSSLYFWKIALGLVESGTIHLYSITENDQVMGTIKSIFDITATMGRKIQLAGTREVHNYSPSQSLMVFDLIVE